MTTIQGYEIHPAAEIFPMMEFADLVKMGRDVQQRGLREPVTLWGDGGPVIDGRNRLEACALAGVEPTFRTVDPLKEGDPIDYVLSLNLHRRQLTPSQRGMVAEGVAKLKRGRPEENASKEAITVAASQEQAAKALNVSRATVQRARTVVNESPELAQKVRKGEMTLSAAMRELGHDSNAAEKRRRKADSTECEPTPPERPQAPENSNQPHAKNTPLPALCMGMHFAKAAIEWIEQIDFNDRERKNAFVLLRKYMGTKEDW